ncbi:uncharacterized protein LOC125035262 [Penaeus chinensis]|uniref:uncharacterized protein LOC125035262 n=1 Tax=Penaeus chinensis TaxID=139456 RepID=UPI001FB78387|nr:uncharacterized protein LOC125035262 [Penaeus chinensis]
MKLSLVLAMVLAAGLVMGPAKAHKGKSRYSWEGGWGHRDRHEHKDCITPLCQTATAGLNTCQDCIRKFSCILKHNCMTDVTDCSAMNSTAVETMKSCLTQLVPSIGPCFA